MLEKGDIYRKVLKICRNVAVIFTIIAVIFNVLLFVNLTKTVQSLSDAEGIITMFFEFGNVAFGLSLIPIIWILYFLVWASIKINNKFTGFNKWLLLILTIASGAFLIIRAIYTIKYIITILLFLS